MSSPALVLAQSFQKIINPVSCHDHEGKHEAGLSEFDSKFGQEEIPDRSFADISGDEVRWIGGFSPHGKTPSVEQRRRMFLGYFRDAVRANFATVHDSRLMLEVFSMCARRMASKSLDPLASPTDWIRGVWKNRHTRKPRSIPHDVQVAKEVLIKGEPQGLSPRCESVVTQ